MVGLDILLGGATGLIGNVVTGVMNYKTLQTKLSHEAKMVALNTAALKEKANLQIQLEQEKTQAEVEKADSQAYVESIKTGSERLYGSELIDKLFKVEGKMGTFFATPVAIVLSILFGFVDWFRCIMRPAITAYLVGLSTIITYMSWDILQQQSNASISSEQALSLFHSTISIVIYLTVTSVTWWFGDRRMAKFLQQMYPEGFMKLDSKKGF